HWVGPGILCRRTSGLVAGHPARLRNRGMAQCRNRIRGRPPVRKSRLAEHLGRVLSPEYLDVAGYAQRGGNIKIGGPRGKSRRWGIITGAGRGGPDASLGRFSLCPFATKRGAKIHGAGS